MEDSLNYRMRLSSAKKLNMVAKSYTYDSVYVKCLKLDFGFWDGGSRKWDFTIISCKFLLALTHSELMVMITTMAIQKGQSPDCSFERVGFMV